jgi:dolichol-phosphate mannosyltransferase
VLKLLSVVPYLVDDPGLRPAREVADLHGITDADQSLRLDLSGFGGGAAAARVLPLELALIIPTLNEHDNIRPLLAALRETLAGLCWEAIFVDDGSTDGTAELVAAIGREDRSVRLIRRHRRRGLSSAVVEGALSTAAPIVAVIDADRQHDEAILPALYRAVANGTAEVAVGTRYTEGGSMGGASTARTRLSQLATRAAAIVTGASLSDPMSGFFVIRQSCLLDALPRLSTTGFKVLLDILMSSPQPLRVVEVPYHFRCRTAGESKLDSLVALQFGAMLLEKLVGGRVPPRLIMFGAVGAVGLLVHLAILNLLLGGLGFAFQAAQAIAVALTIAFNFWLNNAFTYRDRRLRGIAALRGLASFYLVCGIGAAANIGVGVLIYSTEHRWWLAGIAGAAIGAVWNYAASSFLTWQER